MIVYRHHRGTLDESLKTVEEYATEEGMKSAVAAYWNGFGHPFGGANPLTADDVVVDDDWIDDPRCGWGKTRYVCVKRADSDAPCCVGMCCDGKDLYDAG